MSRISSRQSNGQSLNTSDRPLYRSVSRGIGEWATVPACVREAIGELLRNTSSQATPVTTKKSTRINHHDSNLFGRESLPTSCDSSSYIPASARDILLPALAPLTPLSDESVLMSVRTFEDAHRLRQHAVHNTALFHNNVEQLSKEMRYFLLPELRATIQLHPEVMNNLRERTYRSGAEFHATQPGVSERMRFEESLLNDVLDALHALRKASVRFSSNFLSDGEKRDLGINPSALPREQTPRRTQHVSTGRADHSRLSRKHNHSRGTFDEVLLHPPSDDTLSDDEQEEATEHARNFRMSDDRNSVIVQLISNEPPPRSAMRGSNNISAEVEVVPEEAEAYDDRSPRRSRSNQRSEALRSVEVAVGSREDKYDHFFDEDNNEPRMSPSLRTRNDAISQMSSKMQSCQHCVPNVERSAARALYAEDDSDVLLEDPFHEEAMRPQRNEQQGSSTRRSKRPVIDLNPPPPMPQKSPFEDRPQERHLQKIVSPVQSVQKSVSKSRSSPPQHPSVSRDIASPGLVQRVPSSLSGSSEETLAVSPPQEYNDDLPLPVPRPGTPRSRDDFVIIPTPRSISVKKKTVMIPRSASSERSHSQQGTPHAQEVTSTPASMHERRHRTPKETVRGESEGTSTTKSPLRSKHSFTVPR